MNNTHRLIRIDEVFHGTIDGASVHPREAVILAHNHPSGVAEPSQADELVTTRLRDALALVDIRVLDHLVVGGSRVTSFVDRGLRIQSGARSGLPTNCCRSDRRGAHAAISVGRPF